MYLKHLLVAGLVGLLAACGGGDGTPASTTVSGTVVKGPVNGATVKIKRADTGAELATTTTSATGAYSASIAYEGDVVIEASNGTYLDEATGVTTTLATPMKVVLSAKGGSVTGVVTPLTTLAYTYAFPSSGSSISAASYNTVAAKLATQFKLPASVNLATSLPTVSGTVNDYGKLLKAISQYLKDNSVTLNDLVSKTLAQTAWTSFSTSFNAAYLAANGSSIGISFDGSTLTVSGTGAGGGSGTCGVNVKGTITAQGITAPLDVNYCISGIAAGSCTTGNSSLSQAISGQAGVVGAANLNYTYTNTCAAGAFTIALK